MQFLNTSFGRMAYEKLGNGADFHLLFHGFGQNMKAFHSFHKLRKSTETYLIFDLFYHGHSSWKSADQKLTKEIWKEIILQLMEKEGFDYFHLIGYSMGGKFSLITLELFPENVKSLILMAPDGIKTGYWYNLATFPGFLNRLFKKIVFHPSLFFTWMDRLNKVGVLESSLIKFVKSQMDTRTKRAQVYFTWIVFKPLNPDLGKIINASRVYKTPILLLTGKYDKMVTSQNLDRFSSKIPQLHPVELPCGHNSLIKKTAEYLLNERGKSNI